MMHALAEAERNTNNVMEKMLNAVFMKKILLLFILCSLACVGFAQTFKTDTLQNGKVTVTKDSRIDLLGQKMTEYNEALANKIQMVDGYRLMLLNTTDRSMAMQIRSTLLQQFPEQKIYMTFLSPYIKLKFGNFVEKSAAEEMRKKLIDAKIITGNIYLLPEKVEFKPEKSNQPEE